MATNLIVKKKYDGESDGALIKRFLKKVKKEGILQEYTEHLEYKKPSAIKRAKTVRRQRTLKKLRRQFDEQVEKKS